VVAPLGPGRARKGPVAPLGHLGFAPVCLGSSSSLRTCAWARPAQLLELLISPLYAQKQLSSSAGSTVG